MLNFKTKLYFGLIIVYILFFRICSAAILDSWSDPNAYKPDPVLFAHGFALGNPSNWNNVKSSLQAYYSKYNGDYLYLETIDFNDPNGSIDTYSNGKPGWSDTLNSKINNFLLGNSYGAYTKKINLVCHSMGGLAARWYLVHYSNDFVNRIILIGTPNNGSAWATEASMASNITKIGWMESLGVETFIAQTTISDLASLLSSYNVNIYSEAIKDMDPSSAGSGFINKLNSANQPNSISFYGVIGIIHSFLNWYVTGDFNGGDAIVSKSSQLGTGSVNLEDVKFIKSAHWNEPDVTAQSGAILKFLDSTKPEVEITSPNPSELIPINGNSVHVKGKVYKEYLPADCKLNITLIKNDGQTFPQDPKELKPSSLWVPKNPDSPVAEFDEEVVFPSPGIYSIIVTVENKAGLTSSPREVDVETTGDNVLTVGPYTRIPDEPGLADWRPELDTLSLALLDKNLPHKLTANFYINNISQARVGVPIEATTQVYIYENNNLIFFMSNPWSGTSTKITLSYLDLRNTGCLSGTISGTVKADLNYDGDSEIYSIAGSFKNIYITTKKKELLKSAIRGRTIRK